MKILHKVFAILMVFMLTFALLPAFQLQAAAASNHAPTVTNASVALPTIAEDVLDSSNNGITVSSLLNLAGASDADNNTMSIAVTSVDDSNGTWELYDTGAWWNLTRYKTTSDVTDSNVYLVPNGCSLRFKPGANFNGQAFFTFRVWDETSGTADNNDSSAVINASGSNNGGATAFSAVMVTASVTVTAVNDAPEIHKSNAGNAVYFDGANDYIQVPDDLGLSNGSFTVEGWINAYSVKTYARFFDFGSGDGDNGGDNILVDFSGSNDKLALEIWNGPDRSTMKHIEPSQAFPLNTWVYVTAVYNSASQMGYMYWNGALMASGSAPSLSNAVTRTYNYFGRSLWSADQYFSGEMRNIAVWKEARTAGEIATDMNTSFSGTEPNLVLYYPLNDAAGATSIQSTTGMNNGNLMNYSSSGGMETSTANNAMIINDTAFSYQVSGSAGASIPVDKMYLKDVDAGAGIITLTLSTASGGLLSINPADGITINGNQSALLTVSGTINDLNSVLKTLTYLSNTADSTDTITATVNDSGNTGAGGPLFDTAQIGVTVSQEPDPATTPTITVQPPSSVTAALGQKADFAVTVTGPANSSGYTCQWQKSTDGGSTWTNISGANGEAYSITSTAMNDNGTQYHCYVYDAADNTSATSDKATLTVLYPILKAASLTPANGETGVAVSTQLTMVFNENVTANSGNIYIDTQSTTLYTIPVTSSNVEINNNTVTVTLPGNLDRITTYRVLIDTGTFVDAYGATYTGLSDSTAWCFKTAATLSATPPALEAETPSNGAANVAVDTHLTMSFDENVMASSGSIYVISPSVTLFTIPASSAQVTISGRTVTVTLPSSMDYGANYHVLIDSGAFTDSSGNPYAGLSDSAAWCFTTAAAPSNTITYYWNFAGAPAQPYATQTVAGGSVTVAPEAPVRSGYLFNGWYIDNGCTNAWNFGHNTVTGSMALYAGWQRTPKYAVTYNGNGATSGRAPTDSTAYDSGTAVIIMGNTGGLAKGGCFFSGWSYNGVTYAACQSFSITEDATLTAVWTPKPETYTVTYDNNYTGGGTFRTQAGIPYGSKLNNPLPIPARPGNDFCGWYKEAACVNAWNFDLDVVNGNQVLYAKWAESTYQVIGTVDDGNSQPVAGAEVKVIQGNLQFGNTVYTDSNGDFTALGIPNGSYDIVAQKDGHIVTVYITVNNGNYAAGQLILPSGNENSRLEVLGADTPNVVIDKLNDEFDDPNVYTPADRVTVANGGTVELKLTVQNNDGSANKAAVEAAMASNGYAPGIVLDISILKTVTTSSGALSESIPITATGNPITIIIPLPVSLQGQSGLTVYRAHNSGSGVTVDAITTTPNANGERISVSGDGTYLTLYAKFFSTYVIGTPATGSPSSYTINALASAGGNISPSGSSTVTAGSSITYTITPNDGYSILDVLVDGTSAGPVGSYTFSHVIINHTIQAKFIVAQGLPNYDNGSGNKVFIGFASDRSGTMKYIAPRGVTVQFTPNPKSFTDIAGHWGKSGIDFVTQREIFIGTAPNIFSPDAGMTRAMFAAVIGRLYERSYGDLTAGTTQTFSDVNYNDYYGKYVGWEAENNIIVGIGGGKFDPNRDITREEMATIIFRFAAFLGTSAAGYDKIQLAYPDASVISSWASDAAKYCQETGIIVGRDNGRFVPQGTATRAEVSAILERFIEITVK